MTLVAESEETWDQDVVDFYWRDYAACLGVAYLYDADTNPFFREGRGRTYQTAREFCASCPVVVDCLVDSLDDDSGFAGCMSPSERRKTKQLMAKGISFAVAVENIWSYRRMKGRAAVPDAKIWRDWFG